MVDRAFGSRARQLGWKAKAGEDAETRLSRSSIVPFVAEWGVDGSLAAEARQLAGQWLADRTAVDPDIAGPLLNVAARTEFDLREANALFQGPDGVPETRYLPFEFVKANYDAIAAKIPAGSTFGFGEFLPSVGADFCDEKSREELSAFFAPKVDRFAGTRRNLAQVLEGIRVCTAYKAAQQDSVAEFLKKY